MMASSAADRLASVRMRPLSARARSGCATGRAMGQGPRPSQASPLAPISFFQIGRPLFQAVDGGAARLERRRAVSRRRGDRDRDLADRQRADAVVDRDLGAGPFALDLLRDLGQHLLRHLDVRLVLQPDDVGQVMALAAHDAGERDDAAPVRAGDRRDRLVDDERLGADGDLARAGAARDRRQQRDLVAVRERLSRRSAIARLTAVCTCGSSAAMPRMALGDRGAGGAARRRRRAAPGSRARARRAHAGWQNRESRRARRRSLPASCGRV